MSILSNGRMEARVTALEVQVKSMSEALKDGLRDIKDLIESKTDNHTIARRFTIGLMTTIFVGSLATVCALGSFLTQSCVDSKIHPLEVRLSLLEHDARKSSLPTADNCE